MDCEKYIERARNTKSCTIGWTLELKKAQELIKAFKDVNPLVKSTLTQDWEDDDAYRVTFTWESFPPKVPPKVPPTKTSRATF